MDSKKLQKSINYIYWKKEAETKKCNFKEFNEMRDLLKEKGTQVPYTTKREVYENLVYSVVNRKTSNCKFLYFRCDNKYYCYYTNKIDDNKNTRKEAFGKKGIQQVKVEFLKDNQVGFKKAFGYVEEEFKRCVPKVFSYSNKKYYNKVVITSSVDFSSHWPANIQGRLPDAHTSQKFEGRVKPTEEYPFAFYINSGHVAEYGVFDSHDWTNSSLVDGIFRYSRKEEDFPQKPFLEDEKEITVLMKPSKYELGKYYEYFYELRETDDDAKVKANASIGYMHKKKYDRYKMAHIVAIVLGRAQTKTIEVMNQVFEANVIHAVVDGVIYKGAYQIGEDTKSFGNLNQEWVGKPMMMRATNQYIVLNQDGSCCKVKHGGYECYKDGSKITKEKVKSFKDFDNWIAKRSVE